MPKYDSSKVPPPLRGSGPPPNTWFPGPTRVHTANDISIGSAVLQGSHMRTERPRYNGSSRPHLMLRMAMRGVSTVGQKGQNVRWLLCLEDVLTTFSYYFYYATFNAPCVSHKDDESQAVICRRPYYGHAD